VVKADMLAYSFKMELKSGKRLARLGSAVYIPSFQTEKL